MKNTTIFLLLVLFAGSLMAQEKTLLSSEIESGGYGGPLCKVGSINGETDIFFGGQGGWIINHRFVLGGKGYILVNPFDLKGLENIEVGFGCGGALLEYIMASNKLLHFSFECMFGAGGVYNDVNNYAAPHDPIDYTGDMGFVLEPGFNLNLNVTKYFRIAAGVSYRYVNGIEYDAGAPYRDIIGTGYNDISGSDLSGVSAQIVMKFGVF